MAPSEPSGFVNLADGRRIAYDDIGDPNGHPVVYLHGCPDCRLTRPPHAEVPGARIIAVDRPGYGESDPDPEGTPETLARDIELLADAIGLDRFAVFAWSAGAPTAVACGVVLGDRVTAIGLAEPQLPQGTDPSLVVPFPLDFDLALEYLTEGKDATYLRDLESVSGLHEQMARSVVAAVAHGLAGVEFDLRTTMPNATTAVPRREWWGTEDGVSHLLPMVRWQALVTELVSVGWER